jgi:hypothetical protein
MELSISDDFLSGTLIATNHRQPASHLFFKANESGIDIAGRHFAELGKQTGISWLTLTLNNGSVISVSYKQTNTGLQGSTIRVTSFDNFVKKRIILEGAGQPFPPRLRPMA